jgi:hypothetical protein
MATNYARFVALARALIENSGRSVTLAKLSATPSNAAKPWDGPAAPTTTDAVTTSAVSVPAQGEDLSSVVNNVDLFASSEIVYLVAAPVTGENLADYNQVTDDSIVYNIDRVEVLKPGPLVILYAMGASR